MRTLGIVVAASMLLLSACGHRSEEVPLDDLVPDETVSPVSDLAYADVDWEGWTPVYGELRAADEEAVAEIGQRVSDLNASSWTVHEALTDTELAYTPEHVRGSWDRLDLHLDPREDPWDSVVTACTEDGCSELDHSDHSDDADTDAEALASTVAGPYAILRMQMGLPDEVEEALDEGPAAISTVASPAGPWDCLIVAEHRRDLEALVGSPVAFDAYGPGHSFVAWCVDARGLVLLDNQEGRQLPQYDAWRPGVDADATQLLPAAAVSEAPVDPTGDYEDALWATWHGVYEKVRPATRSDLTRLRDRTAALNETSWTGVLDGYGATMSVSPGHVRVDMGFAEWHFEAKGPPLQTPYVLCLEEGCVRVGTDPDTGGGPHVFNNDLDSMTFTWLVALSAQWDGGAGMTLDEPTLSAVVDSPVGPLDCLVAGDDAAALDGAAVEDADATGDEAAAPFCVDQRGLVQQVAGDGFFGMRMPYLSWRNGVDEGFDTYPFPVQDYGED
jgi:hypothetical protein